MEIHLLQATYGDAIHLRAKDEEGVYRNILIDGGTKDTYTYLDRNKKRRDGALKNLIAQIKERNEFIDLLIMTHVDDDHIGGILQWFGDLNGGAKDLVKKVWFNSGRLIFEHFNITPIPANDLIIPQVGDSFTSIQQGADFEEFILNNNLWDRQLIISGKVFECFGLKFTILSPAEKELKKLLTLWEEKKPLFETAGKLDYATPLTELIASDSFKTDDSVSNGSSIAFMVESQEAKLLFAGDAFPTPIVNSLKELGYTTKKPLSVDFVKLSHHGSKKNTNYTLLNLIKSDNFLISTDSAVHGLPDKRCLARVINSRKKVNLYFNYPELASEIFSEQDFAAFPYVNVLSAQNPIVIEK